MFSFLLTEIVVFLIILFLFLILSWVWPPDSPWAPWWQMPKDVIEKMCQMAKISSRDVVYDLGCGTGNALLFVAKKYKATGVGIEIDPIRFLIARFAVWRLGQSRSVQILRKNFFTVDLSSATIIFVYLIPAALKRLTPKFIKELKPGTKFISYVYPLPEELFKNKLKLLHYNREKRIYVYQLLSKPQR